MGLAEPLELCKRYKKTNFQRDIGRKGQTSRGRYCRFKRLWIEIEIHRSCRDYGDRFNSSKILTSR